jgi:hypothetical protein
VSYVLLYMCPRTNRSTLDRRFCLRGSVYAKPSPFILLYTVQNSTNIYTTIPVFWILMCPLTTYIHNPQPSCNSCNRANILLECIHTSIDVSCVLKVIRVLIQFKLLIGGCVSATLFFFWHNLPMLEALSYKCMRS